MNEKSTTITTVDVSPTKDLFIDMLTRDIPLSRAILDLVDNSVDGALSLKGEVGYEDLFIDITTSENEFKIADNCGGILLETAQSYAFRFGRPAGSPGVKQSVGQFGVGMKRTLFKFGGKFKISTTSSKEKYSISVDISEWKKEQDNWTFPINLEDKRDFDYSDRGTTIVIKDIKKEIITKINDESFLTKLKKEIIAAHFLNISKGLKIVFNGENLTLMTEPMLVYDSDEIGYSKESFELTAHNKSKVNVKLIATLVPESQRNLKKGGWYIFCNGRLILEHDQSEKTVWHKSIIGRNYHPDFALFRGYAFITSDDPSVLPWTTTKTGVDLDSDIYSIIRLKLKNITLPFINLLKDYSSEKSEYRGDLIENQYISDAINNLKKQKDFASLPEKQVSLVEKESPKTNQTTTLSVSVDAEIVDEIKLAYDLQTNVAVASYIFKYFVNNELGYDE